MPDDLPRSPTGRVPRWVVDEAAGMVVDTSGWRTAEAAPAERRHGARRGRRALLGLAVLGTLAGAWWLTGASGLPDEPGFALPPGTGLSRSPETPALPPPSADVVALADEAHLSDEGRDLFYGARPALLDAQAFAGRCVDGQAALTGSVVGCYEPGTGTILVYQPADPRLRGFVIETAAHETLHAAWARLPADRQAILTALLEAEMGAVPADSEMLEQIAGSVGAHPENRPTELFAYLGTQVWRDGGLAPELEAAFATVVADRAALVAVHAAWTGQLAQLSTDIDTASLGLAGLEASSGHDRAQLTADAASVENYRQSYLDQVAEVEAMSADARQGLQLSWVWWDGTDLPMAPAEETLAVAAELLARDDADLAAREVTVVASEVASAAERARIEALIADLQGLQAQLDPGVGGA